MAFILMSYDIIIGGSRPTPADLPRLFEKLQQ